MTVWIVKNVTTGEELWGFKYSRYSKAEHAAIVLTRKSRGASNHVFMAVRREVEV